MVEATHSEMGTYICYVGTLCTLHTYLYPSICCYILLLPAGQPAKWFPDAPMDSTALEPSSAAGSMVSGPQARFSAQELNEVGRSLREKKRFQEEEGGLPVK